jgi:hypothetical protein
VDELSTRKLSLSLQYIEFIRHAAKIWRNVGNFWRSTPFIKWGACRLKLACLFNQIVTLRTRNTPEKRCPDTGADQSFQMRRLTTRSRANFGRFGEIITPFRRRIGRSSGLQAFGFGATASLVDGIAQQRLPLPISTHRWCMRDTFICKGGRWTVDSWRVMVL